MLMQKKVKIVKLKDLGLIDASLRSEAEEVIKDEGFHYIVDFEGVEICSRSFIDELIRRSNFKIKFINVPQHLKSIFFIQEQILGKKLDVEYE